MSSGVPARANNESGEARRSLHMPRLNLAMKIGIALATATIAIFVVVGFFITSAVTNAVEESHRGRAALLVSLLQAEFVEATGTISIPNAQEHLDALAAANPQVIRVNLYMLRGSEGRVVASTDHSRIGLPAEPHDLAPLASGEFVYTREIKEGQPVAEVNAPLSFQGKPVAVLGLYLSRVEIEQRVAQSLKTLRTIGAGSLLVLLALHGLLWSFLLGHRLASLTRACRRLMQGDYSHRVQTTGLLSNGDELGVLAGAFNTMAGKIQEQQSALETQATHDSLTGLLNRRVLMQRLEEEVARAERYGTSVTLLMLDLDGFKEINDHHGHVIGDEVLHRFAEDVLRPAVRTTDIVARYGGDEFVVVMPQTLPEGADEACRRLQERLEKSLKLDFGPAVSLGVSVGLASLPQDAATSAELLHVADTRMYEAKQAKQVWRF